MLTYEDTNILNNLVLNESTTIDFQEPTEAVWDSTLGVVKILEGPIIPIIQTNPVLS